MPVEISSIITAISVTFGVFSGIVAIRRGNKQDDRSSAAEMTTVIVKLENISDDIKEVKDTMKRMDEKIQLLDRRITIVEQSTKSAHHRLDTVIGSERDVE